MYIGFPRILLLSFFLLASASLWGRPQEPQGPDRDKFLAELRPYQHEFLAKELKLSREQARDFFPVYDAMDDELQQVADETQPRKTGLRQCKCHRYRARGRLAGCLCPKTKRR